MVKFRLFFLLVFFFAQLQILSFAQSKVYFDETTDFAVLEKKIKSLEKYPEKAFPYIQLYINKAKNEENLHELFNAYDYANSYSTGENQIKYSDSLIRAAIQLKDNNQIGEAFISSAQVFMSNEMYKEALDQTIIGYDYLKINNDQYLVNSAKLNFAEIYKYLSQYYDAQLFFQEVVIFFRNNQKKIAGTDYKYYYLHSLIGLIDTKSKLKKFSESKKLIEEGKQYVHQHPEFAAYLPYFVSSEGTNFYYQKKYPEAISKLEEALKLYDDKWKHLTEKFYIGMSYYQLQQPDKAIPYLQEIEKDYDETGKLFPEFRPAFAALTDIYKQKNDKELQLFYLDKLIAIDQKQAQNQSQVQSKVHRSYTQPQLLQEKKQLERERKWYNFMLFGLGAVAVTGIFAWLYFIKRVLQKKNTQIKPIENLTDLTPDTQSFPQAETTISASVQEQEKTLTDYSKYAPIRKETVIQIQKKLADFENEKKFATPNIKLSVLASEFETNEKYISTVIKADKDETFPEYINNLRLQYFLQLIEIPEYRMKKLNALSEIVGFTNDEMFHRIFKAKFGKTVRQYLGG